MKKRNVILAVILSLILLLIIVLELLNSVQEKVQLSPSGQTNVRIQVGNAAPSITNINPLPNIDLSPSSTRDVSVTFTARDSNGAADLNDATAIASFSSAGEPTRTAQNCIVTGQSGKEKTYQCTITMQYYDKSGLWNVAVSINDQRGSTAQGTSQVTINLLRDISISPATIGFPTLVQGGIDIISSQNTLITNNGNAKVPSSSIEITASDLIGEINPAESIPAANFRASSSLEANVCANGNPLINNAAVPISSAVLPRGPTGSNTGELSYCIILVPESISSQFYSTSTTGGQPWIITLN